MGPGTLRPSPAVPWGSDGGTADQRPRGRGSAECPPLSALKGQSHCVPDLLLSSEVPLSDLLPRARHRTRRAGVPDAQTGPRPREAERLHLVSTRLTGPEADRDPALSSEHVGVCLAGALPPCGHGVCVSCLPVVYRLERLPVRDHPSPACLPLCMGNKSLVYSSCPGKTFTHSQRVAKPG